MSGSRSRDSQQRSDIRASVDGPYDEEAPDAWVGSAERVRSRRSDLQRGVRDAEGASDQDTRRAEPRDWIAGGVRLAWLCPRAFGV